MNAVKQFCLNLDNEEWDQGQSKKIKKHLWEVNKDLTNKNLLDLKHECDLEVLLFSLFKKPNDHFQEHTKNLTDSDYQYYERRYEECKNNYAKSEYGLLLFYTKRKLHDKFVVELLELLIHLSDEYYTKAIKPTKYYLSYCNEVLENIFHIAMNRSKNDEVKQIIEAVVNSIFNKYLSFEGDLIFLLAKISGFTHLIVKYFKLFGFQVDLNELIERNKIYITKFSSTDFTDLYRITQIADKSISISRKLGLTTNYWLQKKAESYVKMAKIRKRDLNDFGFILHIEKALKIYNELNDEEKLKEINLLYQHLRTEQKMETHKKDSLEEKAKLLQEIVKHELKSKNEKDVIEFLVTTPEIYLPEELNKVGIYLNIPTFGIHQVTDKFGNLAAIYQNEDEIIKYSNLILYKKHSNDSIVKICEFFLEAFFSGKITSSGLISYLSGTWLGKETIRKISGGSNSFTHLKSIEGSIKYLFYELEKFKNNQNEVPDFICITDSLVLKAEYILRDICLELEIPTFKSKRDSDIIMEKTLDDLLSDLKDKLIYKDYYFIKFVLTEKVGFNLRNRVAHGLMDYNEYVLNYVVLSLIIILKLSKFDWISKNR